MLIRLLRTVTLLSHVPVLGERERLTEVTVGQPASGGQNSFCCVQTVDVIWAGLDTNQDHLLAIFAAAHCFICGEDNLMAELQVTNS